MIAKAPYNTPTGPSMLWARNIMAECRVAEARTYERYTGYQDPWLFAHNQTQKAVAAFKRAWMSA